MPQIAIRLSDEDHATLLAAARRVHVHDDPSLGAYMREAALAAAAVETHELRVEDVIATYREVMRRARPRLAPDEWRLILDACNGLWHVDEPAGNLVSITSIPYEVADACRLNDLPRKWLLGTADDGEAAHAAITGADYPPLTEARARGDALVRRLAALSYAELAAIADVVRRWWSTEPREVAGPVPGEDGWRD